MARNRKIRFSFFGSIGFLSLMKSLGRSFMEFVGFAWHVSRKRGHKSKESTP